ncbi:OB-fold nucleic acid binding domain-containing protein [Conexibacter sp. W3-3-2]|nr:OB-fold nucleic acid binding domain-containing protein [Conexibacter sp. W3-3-2]
MASLLRTRPATLDDLTIQVAIVRPGPIQGGAVNPYIERRQRRRVDPDYPIPYEHPSLEPVLKDTLGTIIFQDQVIEVAMAFAGFTPGEAEGLRRAMSRKRSEAAIRAYHERFVQGAMREHGVDEAAAQRVYDMIVGFSGFGFPKAHGAAFGLLAYQSTWLRVHHAPEFLCALLDEQPMGFYPPDALVHEAQRRGIPVLPPDVNASAVGCTVVDLDRDAARRALEGREPEQDGAQVAAVRIGLGYVLGVRADDVAEIVAARESAGPFRSTGDLASRAGAGRPALEQLAWSGACDALLRTEVASPGHRRRAALWRFGIVAPGRAHGRDGTQLALPLDAPDAPDLPGLRAWDAMIADYATTGLTTAAHPIGLLRDELDRRGAVSSAALAGLRHGRSVRVGGLVVARQRPGTASGIVFMLLEDEGGTVNLVVPAAVYEQHRLIVRTEPLVIAEGVLERHPAAGGGINVLVRRLVPLEAPDDRPLAEIRSLAEVHDFSSLDERELARRAGEQQPAATGTDGAASGFRAVAPPVMSFAQGRRR